MANDRANIIVGAGTLKVDGVDVGYTEDGVSITVEREYYDVEADQSICILEKKKIREKVRLVTNILEATLENLKIVFGIGNAVATVSGVKTLSFGGDTGVAEHLLVFTGKAPGGFVRTFTAYKAVSIESGEHGYKKGEKTVVPVTFELIEDAGKTAGMRYGSFSDTIA